MSSAHVHQRRPARHFISCIDWRNVAWTHLGTEERMEELGALMTEAQAFATTDMEKRRVALWHDALWKWMEEGRAGQA